VLGTSPGDRTNSPSSASGDDEYTPNLRSDGSSQVNNNVPIKRKRGRVNPAQLAYLERAYTADRSLDATRRKEISQKLGMDERQTQIWFQNRRAKAKLLAHRAKEGGGDPNTPGTPTGLSTPPTLEHFKATLQEDTRRFFDCHVGWMAFPSRSLSIIWGTAIIMVPCSDVLIGKWRRMNTGSNDLLVYLTERRRTLTYYVRSGDAGFKMRIPFDSIAATEYTNEITPGSDRISLLLNKPPTFYREVASRAAPASTPGRTWRPANDWTEGAQASTCTRHEIIGPSARLSMALHPLLATGCAPHVSSSVSNGGLPSYFLPSPSMPYSPSSAGTGISYTNSPPRCSSPQSYFAGMPMEACASRPATSNGIARGDGFPFEPLHRRNRSQSQPPMQFVFNPGGFPQANNPLASPHTGSAGYPVEFGPFVGNLEQANSQMKIGTAADHQQLSFNQPSAFTHAHSDVSLPPEHLSAARPLLSDGFRFPEMASGSQPGAVHGAPGAPALGGPRQRADTFDGFVGLTSPGAHVASPGRPSGTGSATGSRFVDIYSSQNQNLAPYIIGNNGTDGSGNRNPVPPMTPAHTQQFQGMLPFSAPFENPPVPPMSPRASDTMMEQSTYGHVADRVAFPA